MRSALFDVIAVVGGILGALLVAAAVASLFR